MFKDAEAPVIELLELKPSETGMACTVQEETLLVDEKEGT